MRLNAVHHRLYFWLGSALVALMDAPPLPAPETTPKADVSLSRSLVYRQTWRLTGYERAGRRSEFYREYGKILSLSGAGRGHAFEMLISLEPKARLTSGLLWLAPPSLLPCMGPMPNRASTYCGTWHVPPGGCHNFSACCFSVTAGPMVLKFCMHLGAH